MKQQIIEMLKSSDDYVSGEQLSKRLGVTRTAIWKVIEALRVEGYVIEASTRLGYKLVSAPEKLDAGQISRMLKTAWMGKVIHIKPSTVSTNADARLAGSEGRAEGSVYLAESQTAGKGRLGSSWFSPPYENIYMSVLLRPDRPPKSVGQTTLIAGIAVLRALREMLGLPLQIKYPNDIIAGGRKLCGILTELSAEADRIGYLVCGIGVNCNTLRFPRDISDRATSLAIECGKPADRNALVAAILNSFEPVYEEFLKKGFFPFRKEYEAFCINMGRQIRATVGGTTRTGTAVGVSEDGELIVAAQGGTKFLVSSGEVHVRGIYGYV